MSEELKKTAEYPLVKCTWHEGSDLQYLWRNLSSGAVCSPFQTVAFLDSFRREIASHSCKRFAVVSAQIDGSNNHDLLLPVVWFDRGPIKVASIPDMQLSDQNAPVLSKRIANGCRELSKFATNSLINAIANADIIDIKKIHPEIGTIYNPLYELPCTFPDGETLFFDAELLGSEFEQLGKSVYREAKTKFRKLMKNGVHFSEVTGLKRRRDAIGSLIELRGERFSSLDRVDTLKSKKRADFYFALANLDADRSPLKLLTLQNENEVVATVALLVEGNSANGILVAIGSQRWNKFSPGIVLMVQSIHWAKSKGIQNFNFGTGLQSYKSRFGASKQQTRRLLKPLTLKGQAFCAAWKAKNKAKTIYSGLTEK